MDNRFLQAVVDAARPSLTGASIGRIWQPSATVLAVDFRMADGRLLVISVRPDAPATFLALRSVSDLEPNTSGELAFGALLRKRLRGARVEAVRKPEADRVVTLECRGFAASGEIVRQELVIELTGRSSNIVLVDADGRIVSTMNEPASGISRVGDVYTPPLGRGPGRSRTLERELAVRSEAMGQREAQASLDHDLASTGGPFLLYREPSGRRTLSTIRLHSMSDAEVEQYRDPSEAADAWWRDRGDSEALAARSRAVAQRLRVSRERDVRALAAMTDDVRATEGAERFRELAECLLAQHTTARNVDGGYAITDYYSDDQREVFVEADRGVTPQAVADQLFSRHRKAKRTREAVEARRPTLESRIAALDGLSGELERADSTSTVEALSSRLDKILGISRSPVRDRGRSSESSRTVRGARRFVSSDGYEILVGRTSAANDELTFKIARPSDIWLHAADYPGSHVVVKLLKRGDVPHRTLLEAAQLAAYFSQAKDDALVDVRYTERKFVGKPRGASPGLVRLQRFKTVAVRPSSDLARGGDA